MFTWGSDCWNLVTVVDQMAQSVDQNAGVGVEAYAPLGSTYQKWAKWFVRYRLRITRCALLILWALGGGYMIYDYIRVGKILDGTTKTESFVGRSWFWSASLNTEFARMFVGAVVAFLNMLIVFCGVSLDARFVGSN